MKRSRRGHLLALVSVSALVCLEASGQARVQKPVPMATYRDPAGDLSFDYPAVWKIDNTPQFYIPTLILMGDRKARAQMVFLPAGNVYQHTTLLGLAFAYVRIPQPSEETCAAMAVSPNPIHAGPVTIHGVVFQHFETEEGGMCHDARQEIYRTYRDGVCYLFEGDMDTTCSGVVDGQRDLTAAETRALMRHLNAIPQSIRFSGAP